jgi:hypothetical protein
MAIRSYLCGCRSDPIGLEAERLRGFSGKSATQLRRWAFVVPNRGHGSQRPVRSATCALFVNLTPSAFRHS